MFKYAKKNLLRLVVHDKLILFLAMLCVAASVIITHFSYGLYQNYHVLITENENDVIRSRHSSRVRHSTLLHFFKR